MEGIRLPAYIPGVERPPEIHIWAGELGPNRAFHRWAVPKRGTGFWIRAT